MYNKVVAEATSNIAALKDQVARNKQALTAIESRLKANKIDVKVQATRSLIGRAKQLAEQYAIEALAIEKIRDKINAVNELNKKRPILMQEKERLLGQLSKIGKDNDVRMDALLQQMRRVEQVLSDLRATVENPAWVQEMKDYDALLNRRITEIATDYATLTADLGSLNTTVATTISRFNANWIRPLAEIKAV